MTKKRNFWPLKVFVLTLALSIIFNSSIEILLQNNTHIILCVVALLFFLLVALFFDLIAVAVTACDKVPFLAMAARRVKGAKASLWLINRQDKVASICGDVIGDISAIISGALGVQLALILILHLGLPHLLVSVFMSSIIAAFVVGGKAYLKTIAIKNSHQIIKVCGRFILVFGIGEKKIRNKKNKSKDNN